MIKIFLFTFWVLDCLKTVAKLIWFYKIGIFIALKHFLHMFMALFMWYEASFYFFICKILIHPLLLCYNVAPSEVFFTASEVEWLASKSHYIYINPITTLQPFQGTLYLCKCIKEKYYIFFVFEILVPSSIGIWKVLNI